MKRTEWLQEIRKMRFEEAHEGWESGRLTQAEAARLPGVCERTFRRYLVRFEAAGLEGLIDQTERDNFLRVLNVSVVNGFDPDPGQWTAFRLSRLCGF